MHSKTRFLSIGVLLVVLLAAMLFTMAPDARASSATPPVPSAATKLANPKNTGGQVSSNPLAPDLTCVGGLLLNPSFESFSGSNSIGDPIPTSWIHSGGGETGVTTGFSPPDGTHVGYVWTHPSGTPAIMYQQVAAIPGATYSMTFYSGSHNPSVNPTIAIRFYDSGGNEVGTPVIHTITHDIDVAPQSLGGPYTISGSAPATVANLRVIFTDPSASGAGAGAKGDSMCLTQSAIDYGDAPDTGAGTAQGNYKTTAADGGPSHVITTNLKLGTATTDADSGTLQNTAATADNTNLLNDEDGVSTLPVVTPASTTVSLSVNVTNTTGSSATLACWIDFNRDGDFVDTGERAFATITNNQTSATLTFTGFAAPTAGTSYLRCRIASASGDVTNSFGAASSGEVEDYQITISNLDFGDAPDTGAGTGTGNYQTTSADNGPSHVITANLKLGSAVTDIDSGTLQNTGATADNTTGTNDEDGVSTLPTVNTSSTSVSVTVTTVNTTGNNATLACFIDFNMDGDFADTGERASATIANNQTSAILTFTGFTAPTAGTTYLRCRIASASGDVTNAFGAAASGEVEDYQITINALDYGDAPDTGAGTAQGNYQTTAADGGPSHIIVANLQLGSVAPDADNGTLQNTAATSDNTTGTNDEEGVTILPVITPASTSVSLNVTVLNNTGNAATVACWIDMNRDGDFGDTGERAAATVNSQAGTQNITLNFSGFAAPTLGVTYLRCRIASASGDVTNAFGAAASGEVEDYQISIANRDFGDAPDTGAGTSTGNYQTTAADGGPSHIIVANLLLGGVAPDVDSGALQNATATADNTTGTNDEDGVATLPTINTSSTTVSFNVTVFNNTGNPATVACWIDFNRDGDFADTGEINNNNPVVTVASSSSPQTKTMTFANFAAPTAGTSYLRCRISNTASEVTSSVGVAISGEVEDYQVTINALDYGDAPDTGAGTGVGNYQTTVSDGGPSHIITANLRLGTATTDADNGTLQNAAATSDNTTGTNDEDGVTTNPAVFIDSTSTKLSVNVFNNTGSNATLACWIDMNRDGDFNDAGESASATVSSSSSQQQILLNFTGFALPTPGTSYYRCRISSTASEVSSPIGAATSGEVEDYMFTIFNHPTSADLVKFTAKADSNAINVLWSTGSELDIVGFNVWRAEGTSGDFTKVNADEIAALSLGTVNGNDYAFTDSTAAAGTKYTYKLELVMASGNSQWSDTVLVKLPVAGCKTKVTPPTLVGPDNSAKLKQGKIEFTWNAVDCAVKYRIELRAGSPDGAVIADKKLDATTFSIRKLEKGTTYYWRVSACNAKNKCFTSNWWSFKIKKEK